MGADICLVWGPAGEDEVTKLIKYAVDGWNIALMDSSKAVFERIIRELKSTHQIKVRLVDTNDNQDYDIDAFLFHGSWYDEADDIEGCIERMHIFREYIKARYTGTVRIIKSAILTPPESF